MKANILVQYQGGGYSGCMWEWNYFYIDRQGKFHDIVSSGCSGIDNLHDAECLIERGESNTYVYDMSKGEDIATFCKESNAVHVTGVLQWFEDNPDTGVELFAVCSACERKMKSCEDIALEGDLLLCDECYPAGFCLCCESYVGDTEIVKVEPDEHYGLDYICADCKDYHDDEREAESFEGLRFQAFCTGKPDIFSDELRSFWI